MQCIIILGGNGMKHMYVADDGKAFGNEAEMFPLLEKKAPNLMFGIHLIAFFAG